MFASCFKKFLNPQKNRCQKSHTTPNMRSHGCSLNLGIGGFEVPSPCAFQHCCGKSHDWNTRSGCLKELWQSVHIGSSSLTEESQCKENFQNCPMFGFLVLLRRRRKRRRRVEGGTGGGREGQKEEEEEAQQTLYQSALLICTHSLLIMFELVSSNFKKELTFARQRLIFSPLFTC